MNEGEKMLSEEKKYENVINILNKLQRVKAPENFEVDLMNKINSIPVEGVNKLQNWLDRIFNPFRTKSGRWISTRLIPSAALAVAAVIVLFMINTNSSDAENPLLSDPRVREDIITTGSQDIPASTDVNLINDSRKDEARDELKEKLSDKSKKMEVISERIISDSNKQNFAGLNNLKKKLGDSNFRSEISSNINYVISKSGLNFRMVKLNEEEKKMLNEKIKSLFERYNNSKQR